MVYGLSLRLRQPSICHAICQPQRQCASKDSESTAIKVRPHNFKGSVILLRRLGNDITKQR